MQQQIRCLLAWLTQQETSQYQHLWKKAHAALQQRKAYAETPQLEPIPPEIKTQVEAFKKRPDVIAFFQGMNWTVGFVNLHSVLSYQRLIVEEDAIERANAVVEGDLASLFSFCLPPQSSSNINLSYTTDYDQRGITLSSINPNLRIGGYMITDIDLAVGAGQPTSKQKIVGFALNFGGPFIQIAEYEGRWLLRDGYHRCYSLLRRGIQRIPAVFIRAPSFEQIIGTGGGCLTYETVFGPRPPFLKDFLNDTVSISMMRPAIRKVVRVSARDFFVPID